MTVSPFQIRHLSTADMSEFQRVQALVEKETKTGFIRVKSDDDLRVVLSGERGIAYGVFDTNGILVAISILLLPTQQCPNMDAAFPRVPLHDWPTHACFTENTMVVKDARGRGIQRLLLRQRIEDAKARGMRWICSGINLDNDVSIRNVLASGFRVVGMRGDRGYPIVGLLYTFDRDFLATDDASIRHVPKMDIDAHAAALESDFVGIEMGDESVYYQKLSSPPRRDLHGAPLYKRS